MNAAAAQDAPLVGIIMGSQSDWAMKLKSFLHTVLLTVYLNMLNRRVIVAFR